MGRGLASLSEPIGNPLEGIRAKGMLDAVYEHGIIAKKFLIHFRRSTTGNTDGIHQSFHPNMSIESKFNLRYLIAYIQLHTTIIMIMNGKRSKEDLSAQKTEADWDSMGIYVDFVHNDVYVFSTLSGNFMINEETVLWEEEKLLMDKNMVLMFKGICVGRYITINILEGSLSDLLDAILNVFHAGDELFLNNGNISYDTIKLLEPMCILRWLKLAKKTEYDGQSCDAFRAHIESTIKEQIPDASNFYDIISKILNNINDVNQVGTIFGSFHLWRHPFIT